MSTPMTASQIQAQLKKWGINFEGYKNWETHNREGHGAWGPVNGFVIHHTGSDGSDQRDYLYNGDSNLPGPLCQFHIDKTGKVWLIGNGRCNHAGGGDPNVFNHVVAEDYTGILKPHYHEGSSGAMDGNVHFYGVEIGYSGTHEMAPAQYATLLKLCAAVADFHNWTERSFIAHGEWSDWKWDPGISNGTMMNMVSVRGDIKNTIKAGPHVSTPQPPTVNKTQMYKEVWDQDVAQPPAGHINWQNPTWAQSSILRFAAEQAEQANKAAAAAYKQAQSNGAMLTKIMQHLGIS
jgi:hypothetical protein